MNLSEIEAKTEEAALRWPETTLILGKINEILLKLAKEADQALAETPSSCADVGLDKKWVLRLLYSLEDIVSPYR